MQTEQFPSYMETFTGQVFGQDKLRMLDIELSKISRTIRRSIEDIMKDLQIELECRFRHDFGRGDTIFTTEKVFRRVKEYYINQAARGIVDMKTTTSTDRSININRFYKMRETTMDGRDIVLRSIKNSFYTDYESAKYGTKMAASMEISGDTANDIARSLLSRKEFEPDEKMNVRTKTRSSFTIYIQNGISYSIDLTEVESYDIRFNLALKENGMATWLEDVGNPTPVRRSYEIELDHTVLAQSFRSILDLFRELNSRIPAWCSYVANMARDVVYQTNYLVGEPMIRDMFRNVKEKMEDQNLKRPFEISKGRLPQVRNVTTMDLRSFANFAATPKADGVRCIMYFGKNYVALIKPPTEFNIMLVTDYESPYEGLLLDGEFVEMENIKNEAIKKFFERGAYYVFDVISPRKGDVEEFSSQDVIERNNYLRTRMPRETDNQAFEKKLILNRLSAKAPIQGWSLFTSHKIKKAIYFQLKEYEDSPIHPYSAFRSYLEKIPDLQFKDDGLIFTPRYVPYNRLQEGMDIKTLKWKPVELMTIDFLYRGSEQDDNNNYRGVLYSSENRELVPFQGTRFFPYDMNTPIYSDKYRLVNGAVYECAFQDGRFHVHRPRNDKEFPNTLEVAINDWYYIQNPITANLMAGHGYIPLQEYDRYRLWETLQHELTRPRRILDLLLVDPTKDLPQEICKMVDLGKYPSEFSNVQTWTRVHLFDTRNSAQIMPSQRDVLITDVDDAKSYDLILMDGSMAQLIMGDYKRYSEMPHMKNPIPGELVERLRTILADFYSQTSDKSFLLHRMPTIMEITGTIQYGSPDEKMVVSKMEDGSVELLFANLRDRPISLIYDPSIQTTNPSSDRIFCRTQIQFQYEAPSGQSALCGDGLIPYYEWVRTGSLNQEEAIESFWKSSDGSGWSIAKPENTPESLAESIYSSETSGRFSIGSEGGFIRSVSAEEAPAIIAMELMEGETPAEFLVDYDEIQPTMGSLDLMIVKPILKRFSEIPGKLPYNPHSAARFAMEVSEITLRDQDYQFIVDEFDIGIFKIETEKTFISLMTARNNTVTIRSRHSCKNGFMFIRRVDSGKYKLMIPSERKVLDVDNLYRKYHGMVAVNDPILKYFI